MRINKILPLLLFFISSSPSSAMFCRTYLHATCARLNATCVVDFSSPDGELMECRLPDKLFSTQQPEQNFDTLIKEHPGFQWEKIDGIYLIKPRNDKDSALTPTVGPVKGLTTTPRELMNKVFYQANFKAPNTTGHAGDASDLHQHARTFNVKKANFRDFIIRAARQAPHTFWFVEWSVGFIADAEELPPFPPKPRVQSKSPKDDALKKQTP